MSLYERTVREFARQEERIRRQIDEPLKMLDRLLPPSVRNMENLQRRMEHVLPPLRHMTTLERSIRAAGLPLEKLASRASATIRAK